MDCFNNINSPVCEQVFSRLNRYTQVKGMNENHFLFFFIYILDLHNHSLEGRLRLIANPKSNFRKLIVEESNEIVACKEDIDDLSTSIAVLSISEKVHEEDDKRPFKCSLCNATYKLEGYLKNHRKNKHVEKENFFTCGYCAIRFQSKKQLTRHLNI